MNEREREAARVRRFAGEGQAGGRVEGETKRMI
jgi:hypothetical protein